jgi:inorganic triphosphatase YgiF
VEIELKLTIPPDDVSRLTQHGRIRRLSTGRASTRLLRSTYFDTPELDLARLGLTLRVRRTGRSWIQTVKSRGSRSAGLFERMEFECPVSDAEPRLDRIPDPSVRAKIERALSGRAVESVVETNVRRSHRVLHLEGSEILCDIDVGEVVTRRGRRPICELELELASGSPAALYRLALDLQQTFDLRPSVIGKADQGFALLTGERPTPQKAKRPALPADPTLEDNVAAVFASCLAQMTANGIPAWEGADPEGVHQLRVGVRRARSAFSLFRAVMPASEFADTSADLRWAAGELGPARDADVFLEETLEPLVLRRSDDPALKRLAQEAREQREEAYIGVRQMLDSKRYARLLLRLGSEIASRAWRNQPLSAEAASLFSSASVAARPLLERRYRKVMRAGRHLSRRSEAEKHQLRIQVKKLRYASEFLAGAYPSRRKESHIQALSALQDTLGHLNDVVVADRLLERILDRMGVEATVDHHRAAGFVGGWTAQQADEKLTRLARDWKAFSKSKPFWRES